MMQSLLTPTPIKTQGGDIQTQQEANLPADANKAAGSEASDFEKVMQESIEKAQPAGESEVSQLTTEELQAQLTAEGNELGEMSAELLPPTVDAKQPVPQQTVAEQPLSSDLVITQAADVGNQQTLELIDNDLVENPQPITSTAVSTSELNVETATLDNEQLAVSANSALPQADQQIAGGIEGEKSTEVVAPLLTESDGNTIPQVQLLSDIEAAQQASATVTPLNQVTNDKSMTTSENWLAEQEKSILKAHQQELQLNATIKQAEVSKQDNAQLTGQPTKLFSNALNVDKTANLDAQVNADAQSTSTKPETLLANMANSGEEMNKQALINRADSTAPVVDVNGAKPIQTNMLQSDKLVSLNQQLQANNHLLQEPLDLKSKQAGAMVGERVMMMIAQGKQEVQIRLDPAELGSMHIKVQVQQEQVNLNIQTQASLSKDILEQNMPRLREQLAQHGIQLGDSNVEQQAQQQSQQQQADDVGLSANAQGQGLEVMEEDENAVWIPSPVASEQQGIDFYA